MRRSRSSLGCLLAVLALAMVACQPAGPTPAKPAAGAVAPAKSAGATRVVVGITEALESRNPYAQSVAMLYGIWCDVYGCLLKYDFDRGDYVGLLAESWRVEPPNDWVFNLRRDAKWADGAPVTAADVVHSFDRMRNDPVTRQRQNLAPIERVESIDDYTVRMVTKAPTASLLDYLEGKSIITSKTQFERYGEEVWNQAPIGAGPYALKELAPNQHLVVTKSPSYWGGPVAGPDEVVYRLLPEGEVRVTALLNGELQLAQFIPPHMADRVANHPATKLASTPSVEIMFLAMQPKPPFDNKLVRQAVAYAIDRDAIIASVLGGHASRLDGPIGPGQYAYSSDLQPKYTYNPERAKQLLAQAGFPNGVDVELATPVGRYIQDKEVAEAMARMLTDVGIRAKLQTPEWATLWDNVQKGTVPFYYMGRGGVQEPGRALADNFETGVTPRIGYSNPGVDALFAKERASFDSAERQQVLQELMSVLTDEAPAHFLWRHNFISGLARSVDHTPHPSGRVLPTAIIIR